jgi:hypothetical protein
VEIYFLILGQQGLPGQDLRQLAGLIVDKAQDAIAGDMAGGIGN